MVLGYLVRIARTLFVDHTEPILAVLMGIWELDQSLALDCLARREGLPRRGGPTESLAVWILRLGCIYLPVYANTPALSLGH